MKKIPTIQIPSNCGNAPKQQKIIDFIVALAKEKWDDAFAMLADDVHLEVVGRPPVQGLSEVQKLIEADGKGSPLKTLQIDQVISHGKICTARGTQVFADGGKVAFSSWYTFESNGKKAKIQTIQTYAVRV